MMPAELLLTAMLLPVGVAAGLRLWALRDEPRATAASPGVLGGAMAATAVLMLPWVVGGWGGAESPAGDVPAEAPATLTAFGWKWATLPGDLAVRLELRADRLTAVLFVVVGLVGAAAAVFSGPYMSAEPRLPRYHLALGAFASSMLLLVAGDGLLTVLLGWELVGLCSWVLIGHRHDRPAAARAATKAAVVNRLGDAALISAVALLAAVAGPGADGSAVPSMTGLLSDPVLLSAVHPDLPAVADPDLTGGRALQPTHGLMTLIGLLLFAGAAAKSAQFPLHIWLADAMEGPTPVSALIHAATMVAAGVVLMARLHPLLTPEALAVVAYTGAATLAAGGLAACVHIEFKKVLAGSTISQLGLMMLAIGVGSPEAALTLLVAHAFYKALLFLSAGAVRHACGHVSELRNLGGLRPVLPGAAIGFAIGAAAMAGLPPLVFAGFAAKEGVLAAAFGVATAHPLLTVLPLLSSVLTAFYLVRLYFRVFEGAPGPAARRVLRQAAAGRPPSEPRTMAGPMLGLAVLCVVPLGGLPVRQAALHPGEAWRPAAAPSGRTVPDGSLQQQRRPQQGAEPRTAAVTATPQQVADAGPVPAGTSPVASPAEGPTLLQRELAARLGADRRTTTGAASHAWWLPVLTIGGALAGVAAATVVFGLGLPAGSETERRAKRIRDAVGRAVGLDEAWSLAKRGGRSLAGVLAAFDRAIIDRAVDVAAAGGRSLGRYFCRHDMILLDGVVNHVARVVYTAGESARALQTGKARTYVASLTTAVAVAAGTALLLLMPADPAGRLGWGAAMAGAAMAILIRTAMTRTHIGPTTATLLLAAFAGALPFETHDARIGGAGLLVGLAMARLLRWSTTAPSADRTLAVPGVMGLLAVGLWLDSPLFTVGLAAGGMLEACFLLAPRRVANGLMLSLSTVAGACVPDTEIGRAVLTGLPAGMLAGHLAGWLVVLVRRNVATRTADRQTREMLPAVAE